MSIKVVTITAATPGEWGNAFLLANEYLAAERKLAGDVLRKGSVAYYLYHSLNSRAKALVDLGRLMGVPVVAVSGENAAAANGGAPRIMDGRAA